MKKTEQITILEDTREQRPLVFGENVKTIRCKLDVGDYAPEGFEFTHTFERKSISDLTSTISTNEARFRRELEKMEDMYVFKCIVIEGIEEDIEKKYREIYSKKLYPNYAKAKAAAIRAGKKPRRPPRHPNAITPFIIGRLNRYHAHYGVSYHFLGSPHEVSEFVEKMSRYIIDENSIRAND